MAGGGINKVILIGNLGMDPEVRYMPSGDAVANLRIATSESWRDKTTGEPQERTEWHRVVIFGKLAEIAGQYLRKGSKVYVEGRLQTRKWQAQDGQDRYTTEVLLSGPQAVMQMLDGRGGGGGASAGGGESSYGRAAAPAAASSATSSAAAPRGEDAPAASHAPSSRAPTGSDTDFDDDIPF